jgi:hypothetical protein
MEGVRGSIPLPPTTETPPNQAKIDTSEIGDRASTSLNETRTVPSSPVSLGKRRARRSRKIPEGRQVDKSEAPPRRPAEHGANRVNMCSDRKPTAAKPDAQEPERRFYWIANGQTNIGFVEQVDETYRAISADEWGLCTFDSLKAAADAFSAYHEKSSHGERLDGGAS